MRMLAKQARFALLVPALVLVGALALGPASANASGDGDTAGEQGAKGHGGGAPIINWFDFGFKELNEAGEPIEKGGTPMGPPLFWALFNFAVFAGILYWKAGPALSKFLANRHEQIKSALEEGAKLQEEAKEKLKEYSARIADADAEVNALIAQIKKDAEAEREKLISDAKAEAKRMQEDAEARIESEFIAARRDLEREVVAKAVSVAATLLAEKSSSTDQGNLFSAFITDLNESASKAKQSDSADGDQV